MIVTPRHALIAKEMAAERHATQTWGGLPYTAHLEAVDNLLAAFGYRASFWTCCAWLHDILEDTPTTADELVHSFGQDVADTVFAVSGFGPNRVARNADIYAKVRGKLRPSILKAADRIVNVEKCVEVGSPLLGMYVKEKDGFAGLVNDRIPAAMALRLAVAYTPRSYPATVAGREDTQA